VQLKFRIHSHHKDNTINRRFHKFCYTAALRLGVVPNVANRMVQFEFDGEESDVAQPHKSSDKVFRGKLIIEDIIYDEIVLIAQPHMDPYRFSHFVTCWPISQHPDAHKSYTDPLVDTAMDGIPFDINKVASEMHDRFRENAGVSPATLMNLIYQDESEELRSEAKGLAKSLEEALLTSSLESARADREKDRAEQLEAENSALRNAAHIEKPAGEISVTTQKLRLVRAYEGSQGKFNQKAVILEFSDGTTRANNWQGGISQRLEYAKSLEGQFITTDVWGGYNGTKWFKNIYPA
jgi:hypothetical protein